MHERPEGERGTFELWRELSELSRQTDRLLHRPLPWLFPRRRQARVNRLNSRLVQLASELTLRYRGILRELWHHAVLSGQCSEPFATTQVRIWLAVSDQARMRRDPKTLPSVLWRQAVLAFGQELPGAKIRLMLRPFVDAMPDSDSRGLLKNLLYTHLKDPMPADEETVRVLEQGCEPFHRGLVERRRDVASWTDGVVTAEDVDAVRPPYTEYLHWLFAA
jgi:hypothetical protein